MKKKFISKSFLFLIFLLGVAVGVIGEFQYNHYKLYESADSISQLQYDAVLFCNTLGTNIAEKNLDALLDDYFGSSWWNKELLHTVRQKLSVFTNLSLSYKGCEQGPQRSPPEKGWLCGHYNLFFQVNHLLPAGLKNALPEYTIDEINTTKQLVVTVQISKSTNSLWTYELLFIQGVPV